MKKIILSTLAIVSAITFSFAQSGRVGIGTSNPEQKLDVAGSAKANDKVIGTRGFVAGTVTADTAKAIFSTDITNKGFYIPRLTTAEKTTLGSSLNSGNKGLLVFDTDLNRTDFWNGTAWKAVGDGAGGPPTGAAGGDLTGTYPNPNIGNSKVTSTHILDGTITGTDIQNNTIDLTQKVNNVLPVSNGGTGVNTVTGVVVGNGGSPVSGLAASAGNQVLRRNNGNTAYEFAQVQYSDVAGTPSALPPSGTAGGDLTGTYPNPTVGAGKIDNGKLANDAVTTGKILDGTITAADLATTGVAANTYNNVTVNSKGQVTSGSNAAYLTGNQNITLSGDVSGSGTTAISTTIGSNTVTNTKLSDMAQNRIKGRVSSGSGDPEDLTPAQALSVLGITAPTGDNLGNHTATTTLNMSGNGITNVPSLNSPSDNIGFFTNRADDNSYEWIGYYSGGTRQGIMLWDGAWGGANNLTNEFSLTAENSNLLTLNTNNNHIALMPKNGNVGIGTTNPTHKLEVYGSDNVAYFASSGSNAYIRLAVNNDINTRLELANRGGRTALWNPNNGDAFNIVHSTGNVGIGTIGPGSRLDVRGGLSGMTDWGIFTLGDNSGQQNGLSFGYDNGNNWAWMYARTTGCCGRPININNTAYVQAGNGSVGIGNSNPQAKLQVSGGAIRPEQGNNNTAGINFGQNIFGGGGDQAWIRYYQDGSGEDTRLVIGNENDANDEIGFYQAGAERMAINGGVVEVKSGLKLQKKYTYYRGRANEDHAYTYGIGQHDFCYLAGNSIYMDNNATWDIDVQCNVYPTDWGTGVWGDGGNENQLYTTGPLTYTYGTKPTWNMYVESYIDPDAVYCGVICVDFD